MVSFFTIGSREKDFIFGAAQTNILPFELHQKWCLFLQLAAEKKTSFLVQLKQIFCPFYFARALGRVFARVQHL